MENMKSKVLIVGATGGMGRLITKASLAEGHPTFLLVRESASSIPEKAELLESFYASGANILPGSLDDYATVVEAIKKVDVVISAVGYSQLMSQMKLIKAIKEVGNIKRFFPAEFGIDVDRCNGVLEPAKSEFEDAVKIRRAVEAEDIPYTYVVCGTFQRFIVPYLGQMDRIADNSNSAPLPPRDKTIIYGDGNSKGVVVVQEEDVATYTIKTLDDPRTLNKSLYFMPPSNTLSVNELVGIWEKMIDKTLEKVYVSEEELLNKMADSKNEIEKLLLSGIHYSFIKEDLTNFEMGTNGVEATELYPDVTYTTVEEMFTRYV